MRTYDRRAFLRHSATLAATAAAAHALPLSLLGSAASVRGPQRPLEMLVLGDSAMWGQGLNENQKYYNLTREWLGKVLGARTVNSPKVKAHSGASILPKGESGRCHPEVNFSSPTIHDQLKEAASEYADKSSVDLVLVNGGINDLGVFNLVTPSFSRGQVSQGAHDFCYVAMKGLLGEVVKTFPAARVVVTGYFPIITALTPPHMLLELILLALGDSRFVNRFGQTVFDLVRRGVGLDREEAGPIVRRAAGISDLWYRASSLALRRAVREINGETTESLEGVDCEARAAAPRPAAATDRQAPRVVFARPKFCPENGYGVDRTTYLFKLVKREGDFGPLASPIERLKSDDAFFEPRAGWCECKEADKSKLEYQVCQRAGTGHPNPEGAKEFARAIEKALAPVLPFTGWMPGGRVDLNVAAAATTASSSALTELRRGTDHPFFQQAAKPIEVIAHRGGRADWPEETLHAFRESVRLGVHVLEMDVRSTRDCELVLMHDSDVKRTTNGSGHVHEMTLEELKELDAGYSWTKDGKTYPFRCRGIEVPTLREVFEEFRGRRMNIEIKQTSPTLVTRLGNMIREFGMTDKVLVASFEDSVLTAFRRHYPEVATSTSKNELLRFLFLNNPFNSSPRVPDVDAVQVAEEALVPLFERRIVERARRRKLAIHAWTVNSERGMERMIRAGVDGIITDDPKLLFEVLRRTP